MERHIIKSSDFFHDKYSLSITLNYEYSYSYGYLRFIRYFEARFGICVNPTDDIFYLYGGCQENSLFILYKSFIKKIHNSFILMEMYGAEEEGNIRTSNELSDEMDMEMKLLDNFIEDSIIEFSINLFLNS